MFHSGFAKIFSKFWNWADNLIVIFPFYKIAHSVNLTIDTNTTWDLDEYTYDDVLITNNATLTFDGAVTLNATNLTIDAGASISADVKGHLVNEGLGAGTGEVAGAMVAMEAEVKVVLPMVQLLCRWI